MTAQVSIAEDLDLERLFAQARAFELLTHEQEQTIDRRKWCAIDRLQRAMIEDPTARIYLGRLAVNCAQKLPPISQFASRDQHYLLRRELAAYIAGGAKAAAMARFGQALTEAAEQSAAVEQLQALALPASLVVGIAESLLLRERGDTGNPVAAALRQWEDRLPAAAPAPQRRLLTKTRNLLARQVDAYTAARDLLIMHNMRLVYSIAGRHRSAAVPFLDVVQEGTLGLLRAAEKFQFERGFRFSTYAFNWITQAIRRFLGDAAGTIRYPSHVHEQLGRLHGERGRLLARDGRDPGDTRLASSLGLTTDKTRSLLQLRNLGVSLEAPRFDGEEGSLRDSLPGGPFPEPGDAAELDSLRRCLLREIEALQPNEQQVVISRWGLNQGPPLTRAEVADQMSVSREYVRQLENSALGKLGQSEAMASVYRDHRESS